MLVRLLYLTDLHHFQATALADQPQHISWALFSFSAITSFPPISRIIPPYCICSL